MLSHLLPLAAVFGALFAFVTSGPFLLIDVYGVSTERYGFYYGAVCLAVIVGGTIANRLGGKVGADHLEAFSFLLAAGGIAAALSITSLGGGSSASLTICMAIFAVGLGLMIATTPLLLLEAVDQQLRSSASAVSGSAQLVAASGASCSVAVFQDGTSMPMLLTMGALLVIGALGFVLKQNVEETSGTAQGVNNSPVPQRGE